MKERLIAGIERVPEDRFDLLRRQVHPPGPPGAVGIRLERCGEPLDRRAIEDPLGARHRHERRGPLHERPEVARRVALGNRDRKADDTPANRRVRGRQHRRELGRRDAVGHRLNARDAVANRFLGQAAERRNGRVAAGDCRHGARRPYVRVLLEQPAEVAVAEAAIAAERRIGVPVADAERAHRRGAEDRAVAGPRRQLHDPPGRRLVQRRARGARVQERALADRPVDPLRWRRRRRRLADGRDHLVPRRIGAGHLNRRARRPRADVGVRVVETRNDDAAARGRRLARPPHNAASPRSCRRRRCDRRGSRALRPRAVPNRL